MICKAEAAVLLTVTQDHADQIKAAVKAAQPPPPEDEPEDPDGSSQIDAVRAYFEEHHRKKSDASASAEAKVDVQPGTLVIKTGALLTGGCRPDPVSQQDCGTHICSRVSTGATKHFRVAWSSVLFSL